MSEFPWETKKREEKQNHIDNGYEVDMVHSGQKRAYGDTFTEFTLKTSKPKDEVEKYCTESVYPCKLTKEDYLADERGGTKDFGDHFRSSYELIKKGDDEYFYRVTRPSAH